MATSITVTPAAATPAAPVAPAPAAPISLTADAAKLYADAILEAKAEIAKIEAVFTADEAAIVAKVKAEVPVALAWLKANWPHILTWGGVGFLVLKVIKFI
jgi:hypothetical protein